MQAHEFVELFFGLSAEALVRHYLESARVSKESLRNRTPEEMLTSLKRHRGAIITVKE